MYKRGSSVWRLSGMLFALLGLALFLTWLAAYWTLVSAFEEANRAVILDDLGEYQAAFEHHGVDAVRTLFASGRHEQDQMVRILDAQGRTVLDVRPAGVPPSVWAPFAPNDPPLPGATQWGRYRATDGTTWTLGRRRLDPLGGLLDFARDDAADLDALRGLRRRLTLVVGLVTLLGTGLTLWFADRVLRPVHGLIADARRLLRLGPTGLRLHHSRAIPELAQLADAFNEALHDIQVATGELEAANDQLAHEVRTPLARVRANIENILVHAATPDAREEAIHAIAEIDRATRLIQSVLVIRAGEGRTLHLSVADVDLRALAASAGELYGAAAEQADIRLVTLPAGGPVVVRGDPDRLLQALSGYLDNALAYAGPGATVELTVQHDDAFGTLVVADSGPGIAESDLGRIWQRFVRGSAAPASVQGIGLGLSVVRSIVRAHHGTVGARNRAGNGAEFWFSIPLAHPVTPAALTPPSVPAPPPSGP